MGTRAESRRFVDLGAAALLTALTIVAPVAAVSPVEAEVTTTHAESRAERTTTTALLRGLDVRAETSTGYTRSRFRHWIDRDGDCRDTRAEVLRAEGRGVGPGCAPTSGRWSSVYDGAATADPSTFDVDHLVPLAEAWRSGAKRWTPATRTRFANDLRFAPSLIAVSASANRSKGDREPQDWLPAFRRCAYVGWWLAVKTRWRLAVDRPERRFLRASISTCGDRNVAAPPLATIHLRSGQPGSRPAGDGTDPRFDWCYQAVAAGYGPYVQGRDPEYRWYRDNDDDGVVCES